MCRRWRSEIFRHSISSGVFTTRAPDMAGQALVVFTPARSKAAIAEGSAMSSPIGSPSTPFSLRTSTIDCTILSAMNSSAVSAHFHVMAGRIRPSSHGASIFAHSKSEPAVSNRTGSPPRGSTQ